LPHCVSLMSSSTLSGSSSLVESSPLEAASAVSVCLSKSAAMRS
jgi:hypothetical protein